MACLLPAAVTSACAEMCCGRGLPCNRGSMTCSIAACRLEWPTWAECCWRLTSKLHRQGGGGRNSTASACMLALPTYYSICLHTAWLAGLLSLSVQSHLQAGLTACGAKQGAAGNTAAAGTGHTLAAASSRRAGCQQGCYHRTAVSDRQRHWSLCSVAAPAQSHWQ